MKRKPWNPLCAHKQTLCMWGLKERQLSGGSERGRRDSPANWSRSAMTELAVREEKKANENKCAICPGRTQAIGAATRCGWCRRKPPFICPSRRGRENHLSPLKSFQNLLPSNVAVVMMDLMLAKQALKSSRCPQQTDCKLLTCLTSELYMTVKITLQLQKWVSLLMNRKCIYYLFMIKEKNIFSLQKLKLYSVFQTKSSWNCVQSHHYDVDVNQQFPPILHACLKHLFLCRHNMKPIYTVTTVDGWQRRCFFLISWGTEVSTSSQRQEFWMIKIFC